MVKLEIDKNGNRRWYDEEGLFHRVDGPAIEYWYGAKEWCIHGRQCREDGPTQEYGDGARYYWEDEVYILKLGR